MLVLKAALIYTSTQILAPSAYMSKVILSAGQKGTSTIFKSSTATQENSQFWDKPSLPYGLWCCFICWVTQLPTTFAVPWRVCPTS